MDSLRHLVGYGFGTGLGFSEDPVSFKFINIQDRDGTGIVISSQSLSKAQVVTELAGSSDGHVCSTIAPSIKLVEVKIGDPFPFYLEQDTFLEFFRSVGADNYIFHLIRHNSYGFHQFSPNIRLAADSRITSYFVSTLPYMLIWSFNESTRETKAILMRRGNVTYLFEQLYAYLETFLPCLTSFQYSAGFLGLVVSTQLVHHLDTYILTSLHDIRNAEAGTGHGDMVPTMEKLDLNELSQAMGHSITVLANVRRHLLITAAVIAHASKMINAVEVDGLPVRDQPLHRELRISLLDVLSTLDTQVIWNESYTAYLLERAKSQISVLQGLLTHEDVRAARDLARAAKEDSSSMKTIAIMTMLFLPGTFFAALFAMPVLKWDEPNVTQERFWVYWAFTLPATALVFLVWNILLRWTKHRDEKKKGRNGLRSPRRQPIDKR